MKIRVCIPFYNEFETAKLGLQELQNYQGPHSFDIEPRQGVLIGRARNSLINDQKSSERRQEPAKDYDAFLFVDSDIGFTVTDVLKLIEHNKPITAAPYLHHGSQRRYVCGMFDSKLIGKVSEWFEKGTSGLKKVDFVGGGFLLVWREAFRTMDYPWFRHILIRDGSRQEETGEDVGFCVNAGSAGYPIFCDFDISLKHKERDQKSFNWSLTDVRS